MPNKANKAALLFLLVGAALLPILMAVGLIGGLSVCPCLPNDTLVFDPTQGELASIPFTRPPIDRELIIRDPNGIPVASDRLNIAIKDSIHQLRDLVVGLRKAFPDTAYRVVFQDPETGRVQWVFPVQDIPELKTRLRAVLPQLQLLIWEESLFTNINRNFDASLHSSSIQWHLRKIGVPAAWAYSMGDSSVVVAVIDDGLDCSHPSLNAACTLGYNLRTRNDQVNGDSIRWHGTHVAGLVAAAPGGNRGGMGVAPHCSLMPIQLTEMGEDPSVSDVIDGILYAIRHGAHVINLSLGRQFDDALAQADKALLDKIAKEGYTDEAEFWGELFEMADARGVTVVIAAGNQGLPVGLDPMQRHGTTIKVAAVDSILQLAAFSNRGFNATISAPGVEVLSCMPGGGWRASDGTSMAAPIVAGAVALAKSMNPNLSNKEIVELIVRTGTPVGGPEGPMLNIEKFLQAIQEGLDLN